MEIYPASFTGAALRVEMFGDEIERIREIDPLTCKVIGERTHAAVFPASHYVSSPELLPEVLADIKKELKLRLAELRGQKRLLEAQRLEQRTRYDLEMMKEVGFCSGIENYSRHFDRRPEGSRPYTLLDYFPEDFLVILDESHITIPQINGMYRGDYAQEHVGGARFSPALGSG